MCVCAILRGISRNNWRDNECTVHKSDWSIGLGVCSHNRLSQRGRRTLLLRFENYDHCSGRGQYWLSVVSERWRRRGIFADGALVGQVKQEPCSLVEDTTAMVKSEVLLHSATSTDGASRMSSIKGQILSSLIRLRFYESEGEILRARREECKRASEQVRWIDGSKRSRERTVNSPALSIRKWPAVMAAHRTVSSSHVAMIKAWISERMSNVSGIVSFGAEKMFYIPRKVCFNRSPGWSG